MSPDDGTAAVILPQFHQLREKPGREETGISPYAAVAKCRDFLRLLFPQLHQCRNGFPTQKRLVCHLKQHTVTVLQPLQSQFNGVADAEIGMLIMNRCKVELLCKPHDLWILTYDDHRIKGFFRHSLQRPQDHAPAPKMSRQLIFTKPPGIARGHHHTPKFHQNTPVFPLIPVYPLSHP